MQQPGVQNSLGGFLNKTASTPAVGGLSVLGQQPAQASSGLFGNNTGWLN